MNRKQKKAASAKSAALQARQQKAMKDRFVNRTREIILRIGGEELLEKFTAIYIEKLHTCRYPSLKAKRAEDSDIPKHKIIQFHKLMHQLMEKEEVPLANGNKISLTWYLSEGMTLIDAVSTFDTKENPKFLAIKSAFAPYEPEGKVHDYVQELLVDIVTDTCRFLSDYQEVIYRADLADTPYFSRFNPDNDVIVRCFKPVFEHLSTQKGRREALQLGWPTSKLDWFFVKVRPSQLGFKVTGIDMPLDVYVSRHALQRLTERINISPGIMHEILLYTFMEEDIPHHFKGQESLVEYRISGQKAGYFVVKWFENRLMIHTFLFLTNNDTPEGEKLNRLASVEKTDKKYLEIDNLPDFNAYHIERNETLSKLFKDAGCASLLKLGHLQAYSQNEIADKDPESVLRYLADAPYFRKHAGQRV